MEEFYSIRTLQGSILSPYLKDDDVLERKIKDANEILLARKTLTVSLNVEPIKLNTTVNFVAGFDTWLHLPEHFSAKTKKIPRANLKKTVFYVVL